MAVDITNHLIPYAQVKRMLEQAWDEGYEAGADDEAAHARGVTTAALNQYTPNPYRDN